MHPLEQWFRDRKAAGERVRRRELARRVDCSVARISQITKGAPPSLELAARLSRETGIPIEQFVPKDAA